MLNHFLKNSLGGHEVDFWWTTEAFFKITDFSFFDVFLKNGHKTASLDI